MADTEVSKDTQNELNDLRMSDAAVPLYEHVMIARQDLSNAQAEGLIEHFGAVLADNGGRVLDSEYWGVKTMAYKINKNRKGHYAFLRTDAPASGFRTSADHLNARRQRFVTPSRESRRAAASPGRSACGARRASPTLSARARTTRGRVAY